MSLDAVLLVDDNVMLRNSILKRIKMDGHPVVGASDGLEALKILQNVDYPCLIVLDLKMPVMSGWEFLRTLKEDPRYNLIQHQVVILSSASDAEETAKKEGILFLGDSSGLDDLLELIRERCSMM